MVVSTPNFSCDTISGLATLPPLWWWIDIHIWIPLGSGGGGGGGVKSIIYACCPWVVQHLPIHCHATGILLGHRRLPEYSPQGYSFPPGSLHSFNNFLCMHGRLHMLLGVVYRWGWYGSIGLVSLGVNSLPVPIGSGVGAALGHGRPGTSSDRIVGPFNYWPYKVGVGSCIL